MTTKSDSAAYQADEPKQGPNTAVAQGVSRRRTYCSPSCPPKPIETAPMTSGMRAPEDSPRNTIGMPLRVAEFLMK